MRNLSKYFKKTFEQEIYENLLEIRKDHDLHGKLMEMQMKCGISPENATQNSADCIRSVALCESIHSCMYDDGSTVMKDFLQSVAENEDREMILLKLLFGLTLNRDEKITEELAKGLSEEQIFYETYYPQNVGKWTPVDLEQKILRAMESYRVSVEELNTIVNKWKKSEDYMITALNLSEYVLSKKCLMTMSCFLQNEGKLTMNQAANKACFSANLQNASDALGETLLKRDMAEKTLNFAAITLVVGGVAFAVYQAGVGAALLKAAVEAKSVMLPVPEIFTEIASVGGSEPMGYILTKAEVIREALQGQAALAKKLRNAGCAVSLISAASVTLSSRFADCIGGLVNGFTRDKQSHLEGLQSLSEYVAEKSITQVPSAQYTPVTAKNTISQKELVQVSR